MRLQWTSETIKDEWAPKVHGIQTMIRYLEIQSVISGQRSGALFSAPPGSSEWIGLRELNVIPFGVSKSEDYSSSTVFPKEGEPYVVRALVTPDSVHPNNDIEWGTTLGYPQCCIDFFMDFWVKRGLKDPLSTLTMGAITQPLTKYTNVALRVIGVRPVFHLPCSLKCEGTVEIARKLRMLAVTGGYGESVEAMDSLLAMPFNVSAKNGTAEIVHPFFRACYATDPGAWIVHFKDESVLPSNGSDLFWKDNGFNNVLGMEQSHQEIVNRVVLLEGIDSIVDLGAGNGYLASKLGRAVGAKDICAVEVDPDKCGRGSEMFPDLVFKCVNINLADVKGDLVLISSNRFKEGIPADIYTLADKYLLVYAYSDGDMSDVPSFPGMHVLSTSRNVAVYGRTV